MSETAASNAAASIPEGRTGLVEHAWRRSYPGLAAILFFSVFINILRLATPIYVLQLLDRVAASGSYETLVMLTIMTLVAVVTGVLLEVVRRRMFMHWGSWIEGVFGPRLFTAGLRSEPGESPLSSRMLRDVATMRSFASGNGIIAWLDVAWAPVFALIVFMISPPLGYVVVVAALLTIAIGTASELMTRDSRNATLKASREDREWVASAERQRDTVGSLNMGANLAERWFQKATDRSREANRTRTLHIYLESVMRIVERCLRIAVLGIGIWLVIGNHLTIGAVIAANLLGRTSYSLVQNAMMRWREMVTARNSYGRLKAFLAKEVDSQVSVPKSKAPKPLVLDSVSYRYPNQPSSVFRDVNVTVQPGEVLCVVGPSASGKTTLMRLVSGLLEPRSGKVQLGDVDVYRLQAQNEREIGSLPQEITLFPGTVRENIARMAEGKIERVVRAARRAGIHEIILKLPKGYDTEIADHEPLLSAGQRKAIAIARAYYSSPRLIVMDEPIPHLDEGTRRALYKAVLRWKRRGTIVVMTTQSDELIRFADKVLVFDGRRHELLQGKRRISRLYRTSEDGGMEQGERHEVMDAQSANR